MKSFDAIIGHKKIISHFEEAIKTGKVSHAYLLSGEDGSGKMMIAKAVAKALLCEHKDGCGECAACKQVDSLNHPDVIYITHEKYEIRVDDIGRGAPAGLGSHRHCVLLSRHHAARSGE